MHKCVNVFISVLRTQWLAKQTSLRVLHSNVVTTEEIFKEIPDHDTKLTAKSWNNRAVLVGDALMTLSTRSAQQIQKSKIQRLS